MRKSSHVLIVAAMLLAACAARAEEPITSVKKIRALSPKRAAREFPVNVKGQVLRIHSRGRGFFLLSEGKGVYASYRNRSAKHPPLSPGDIVRVFGKTAKGNFSPSIEVERVKKIGSEPLPDARQFRPYEMFQPGNDCDWVTMVGRLISVREFSGRSDIRSLMIELEYNEDVLDVEVPLEEGAKEKIAELMFERVRFSAVAGTVFNSNRQMVGRIFYANSVDTMEVIDDYQPSGGIQIKDVHELMQTGARVRFATGTHGTVTYVNGTDLVLRGEKASLRVTLRSPQPVQVGDVVEMTGFVHPQPISPTFLAKEIRVVEQGPLPKPQKMKLGERLEQAWGYSSDAHLNQELVSVEAELVDVSRSFGIAPGRKEVTLLMRSGTHLFEAKLADEELPENLESGAMLHLTGICNLIRNETKRWRLFIDSFWIQLRDAEDIAVLSPAPWWTTSRLLWALGLVLGVLGLILVWVIVLRRTVDKQTTIIGSQIERETISEERQRIARELHDNLEQGLAGMAIQLRGCLRLLEINLRRRLGSIEHSRRLAENCSGELAEHLAQAADQVEQDATKNRKAIEVVQGMLVHCSTESRNSIMDLRGGLLEKMDLPSAIRQAVEQLAAECGAEAEVMIEGTPRRLKQEAERNLLLIVKEAASNAARHAEPDVIRVEMAYEEDRLTLRIVDDGTGFAVDAVPTAGRFGLQGMHERINKLNGMLQIRSSSGEGTSVGLEIPSLREWELT